MTTKFRAKYDGRPIVINDDKAYKVNRGGHEERDCDLYHNPHYHCSAYFEDSKDTDDICYEAIEDSSVEAED